MATHEIPRNVKGEGRLLMVFSTKSLIYTSIGAAIGLGLRYVLLLIKTSLKIQGNFINYLALGIIAILAFAGYAIAMFKVPESNNFEITRKNGGEKIDDVILRALRFKTRGKRIYINKLTKEESK